MASIKLNCYTEVKPHRIKRIAWAIVNATVYPLLCSSGRRILLSLFGAKIGKSLVYRSVRIYAPWNLQIGDYSCIGPRVELYCKGQITIGSHVVISQDAYICTASHDISSARMELIVRPLTISDYAWIAAKAVVLPGVTIGEGGVIGCSSVVPRDVAAWTVVVGNPAKVVKKRVVRD